MKNLPDTRIPDLAGRICTALWAEQSWYRGRLQHLYNAFYLQIEGHDWHRFRIHCVGLYWKPVPSPTHPTGTEWEGWEFRLTSVKGYDITGRQIERIDAYEDLTDQELFENVWSCREAGLRIYFTDGSHLEFHYIGDDLEIGLVENS